MYKKDNRKWYLRDHQSSFVLSSSKWAKSGIIILACSNLNIFHFMYASLFYLFSSNWFNQILNSRRNEFKFVRNEWHNCDSANKLLRKRRQNRRKRMSPKTIAKMSNFETSSIRNGNEFNIFIYFRIFQIL